MAEDPRVAVIAEYLYPHLAPSDLTHDEAQRAARYHAEKLLTLLDELPEAG